MRSQHPSEMPPDFVSPRNMLRLWRKKLRLTKSEFARLADLSEKTISRAESGHRVKEESAARLVDVLNERLEAQRGELLFPLGLDDVFESDSTDDYAHVLLAPRQRYRREEFADKLLETRPESRQELIRVTVARVREAS